ncbi:hypothetical protein GALL_433150 [mine drainage metagenome]|uniref:Uncharacterized protein n=1 Tax=mine drainage metagenome TaxID=410659 RepID=A0A1J5Q561_9ZZZZ
MTRPIDIPAVDSSALTTHRAISDAVYALEKRRRDAISELIRDFDRDHYRPNLALARQACATLGHQWSLTHFGPLGDPWYCCGVCHATECRREERDG